MAVSAMLLLLAVPLLAPQLLVFPHKTETDIGPVWSDEALNPEMLAKATIEARSRIDKSPLAQGGETRWIFITNGGWRWHYVANFSRGAFAITRPFTPAIVINQTDPASGMISNSRALGGRRGLAGVLAHEFTHGLIREHFGLLAAMGFPRWKIEGYCDYVAGESSLTKEEATQLKAKGENHPALLYFDGRERVEAILDANGGSVEALFDETSNSSG